MFKEKIASVSLVHDTDEIQFFGVSYDIDILPYDLRLKANFSFFNLETNKHYSLCIKYISSAKDNELHVLALITLPVIDKVQNDLEYKNSYGSFNFAFPFEHEGDYLLIFELYDDDKTLDKKEFYTNVRIKK